MSEKRKGVPDGGIWVHGERIPVKARWLADDRVGVVLGPDEGCLSVVAGAVYDTVNVVDDASVDRFHGARAAYLPDSRHRLSKTAHQQWIDLVRKQRTSHGIRWGWEEAPTWGNRERLLRGHNVAAEFRMCPVVD